MDLCKRYNQMVEEKEKRPNNPEELDPYIILDNRWIIGEGVLESQPGDILWVWDGDSTDHDHRDDYTTDGGHTITITGGSEVIEYGGAGGISGCVTGYRLKGLEQNSGGTFWISTTSDNTRLPVWWPAPTGSNIS